MPIGSRRSRNTLLAIAVMICLGSAVRRIQYIYTHFTLSELIDHEKHR